MKAILLAILLAATLLSGCAQSTDSTPKIPVVAPEASYVNPKPAAATGLEFVAQLKDAAGKAFPSAGGNIVFGDYVFSSGLNAGFFIADIHDPTRPVLLYNSTADSETPFARKADIVAHPDGRRTLVMATQNNGMHLWNVTDPAHPEFASITEFERNHNIAVLPGTELVFNLPSAGAGGSNDLVDVRDPYEPRVLGGFGSYGCHTMAFFGRPGEVGARAFCAAIQRTEIWDLSTFNTTTHDFGIKLLGTIEGTDSPITGNPAFNPQIPPNPVTTQLPVRNLHHFVAPSNDGKTLIIGDEHRGGGNPGACFASQDVAGTTASTPLGALWFYDITNPLDPVLKSWISPPLVMPKAPTTPTGPPADPMTAGAVALATAYSAVPNCTAHFGTVIPGEDKIVIAWYSAGILLIDFSDRANPAILDQEQPPNVDAWNARVWNGYVFTGDIQRGMDVYKLV